MQVVFQAVNMSAWPLPPAAAAAAAADAATAAAAASGSTAITITITATAAPPSPPPPAAADANTTAKAALISMSQASQFRKRFLQLALLFAAFKVVADWPHTTCEFKPAALGLALNHSLNLYRRVGVCPPHITTTTREEDTI